MTIDDQELSIGEDIVFNGLWSVPDGRYRVKSIDKLAYGNNVELVPVDSEVWIGLDIANKEDVSVEVGNCLNPSEKN